MAETDVERLVQQARSGDEAAFGALYDVFAPRLFRWFRFRVAAPDVAEDLTQRVFLTMIEQLPRYEPRGVPFGAWLFRVARNAWIDHGRAARPAATLDSLASRASDAEGPDVQALASMDMAMVGRAMAELPGDQREVLEYRFLAGLSSRETATLMSRSEGSVRVLQHRALAALRRRLEASGYSASGSIPAGPSLGNGHRLESRSRPE